MNLQKLRTLIPLIVLILAAIGFALGGGLGTISAFGWQDISILCPLGALSAMLASKLAIPRALVSLVIVIVLIIVLGKAYCAWVCPVPLVSKIRGVFEGKKRSPQAKTAKNADEGKVMPGASASEDGAATRAAAEVDAPSNSRYFVLAFALITTLIFGFPVFCVVCPIGLTFASIFLIMRLFAFGDVTWAVVVVPAVLLLEVVLMRRWCHTICPLGAFISLVSRANKTLRPTVDPSTCLESSRGAKCAKCTKVCPEHLDPRTASGMHECTKCLQCVSSCPAHALSVKLLAFEKPATGSADLSETK